jgi:hypothetical protein
MLTGNTWPGKAEDLPQHIHRMQTGGNTAPYGLAIEPEGDFHFLILHAALLSHGCAID